MARAVVKFAAKVQQRKNMHKKQQYCYFRRLFLRQENNNIASTHYSTKSISTVSTADNPQTNTRLLNISNEHMMD